MGRLSGFTPRDVDRVARGLGWRHLRTRGSHSIYQSDGSPRPLVIPQHRELREGTLHEIVNQLGLTVDEFLERARR